MADPVEELRRELRRIDQQLQELLQRVERLERYAVPRAEHPSDLAAVRQKVTYDWQG